MVFTFRCFPSWDSNASATSRSQQDHVKYCLSERKRKTPQYTGPSSENILSALCPRESNLNLIWKQQLQSATSTSHVHYQHFQGGRSRVSQLLSQLLKGTFPREEGFSCPLSSDGFSSQVRLRKTCSLSLYFRDRLPSSNLLSVTHRTVKISGGQFTTFCLHTHPPSAYCRV